MNPVVIIPARMASTRLPGKPLAVLAGEPMIVHVLRRAQEADVGPVVVACAEDVIADVVSKAGGIAILTNPNHPSGSDRIWEALKIFDPEEAHDVVINVQGDLPTIGIGAIKVTLNPLENPAVDISTLVTEIKEDSEIENPNIVKVVIAFPNGERVGRALYFSRATVPAGSGPLYHHLGLYAFRRSVLEKFIHLPPSILEQREKLEQLRALENGMRIDAALVNSILFSVDTFADLERAELMLSKIGN